MSENNQMMSIQGQLCGMPLAGPESFSQQQLEYLKRALGVDETVLYESNTAVAQGSTITLSETPNNFDRVRIYLIHSESSFTWSQVFEYPGTATRYDVVMHACDQSGNLLFDKYFYSRSDVTITVGLRRRHNLSTAAQVQDLSVPSYMMKVVGVHRIAGGNT